MIYLASPYTHDDPAVREERFRAACRATADLFRRGLNVVSPVAHTHPLVAHGGLDEPFEFWHEYDRDLLSRCDSVLVLMLAGWEESTGVRSEIAMARSMSKPIEYMEEM